MTSKKELVNQLDGKTNFSKSTLMKMTLGELKSLVGDDKPVEKQKQKKEPVVVAKTSKPRRREPVLREFSDSEEEQDEQKEEQEKEQEQKEEVVEPEKEAEKPVVEQRQRGRPSNKNKIKAPKLSVEQASKEVTPPQSPQPKTLTTSELRKVLRADYFKGYEHDVKEVLCEYKQGDLTINQVVQEYTLLRDDFLVKLNNFLDTQRKLSDVQLDYIDSLLQRVADRVESELH